MCNEMLITLRGTVGRLFQQLRGIRRIARPSCCSVRAVRLFNKQPSHFVKYCFTITMQILSLRILIPELYSLSL